MTDLAPAIHSTASGSVITANDAAEGRPFPGAEGVWADGAGTDYRGAVDKYSRRRK